MINVREWNVWDWREVMVCDTIGLAWDENLDSCSRLCHQPQTSWMAMAWWSHHPSNTLSLMILMMIESSDKWDQNQWYLMANGFEWGVMRGGSVVARTRQAWLSSKTVPIVDKLFDIFDPKVFLILKRTVWSWMSLCTAVDSAMYSVSIVESAISVWSTLFHRTGAEPRVMTKPVRHYTVAGLLASLAL